MEEREWQERMYAGQCEVAALVARLVACLERAPWMPGAREVAAEGEAAGGTGESPEREEQLPTWILTDGQVAAVEAAIEQEQRVRGRAYGG